MIAPTCICVGLPAQSSLLFVIFNRVLEAVLVHEVMAGVVGRINIDHLHLAVVAALQELQHFKVIALDIKVLSGAPIDACILIGTKGSS